MGQYGTPYIFPGFHAYTTLVSVPKFEETSDETKITLKSHFLEIAWAAAQVSHLALIPELSPSQDERTGLTAIRYYLEIKLECHLRINTSCFPCVFLDMQQRWHPT